MNFPILPVGWVRLGCWVGFPPGKRATPPLWPCHRLLDTMAWLLPVLQARQRRNAVPCPTRRFEGSHNARQIAADQHEIGGFHQHGRLSWINQLPDCWAWWAWRACEFLQTWSLRIVSGSVIGLETAANGSLPNDAADRRRQQSASRIEKPKTLTHEDFHWKTMIAEQNPNLPLIKSWASIFEAQWLESFAANRSWCSIIH